MAPLVLLATARLAAGTAPASAKTLPGQKPPTPTAVTGNVKPRSFAQTAKVRTVEGAKNLGCRTYFCTRNVAIGLVATELGVNGAVRAGLLDPYHTSKFAPSQAEIWGTRGAVSSLIGGAASGWGAGGRYYRDLRDGKNPPPLLPVRIARGTGKAAQYTGKAAQYIKYRGEPYASALAGNMNPDLSRLSKKNQSK